MSSVSAYFTTVFRLTWSIRAISDLERPAASIDRISFTVSRGTVISSILPGRARQSNRPGKPYGEGRALGPRGAALLLKLLNFSCSRCLFPSDHSDRFLVNTNMSQTKILVGARASYLFDREERGIRWRVAPRIITCFLTVRYGKNRLSGYYSKVWSPLRRLHMLKTEFETSIRYQTLVHYIYPGQRTGQLNENNNPISFDNANTSNGVGLSVSCLHCRGRSYNASTKLIEATLVVATLLLP